MATPLEMNVQEQLVEIERVVPSDELVTFTPELLPSNNRIGNRAIVGDDGTVVEMGFYDHELETTCFLINGEASLQCILEEPVSTTGKLADAACTVPAVATDARFADESADDTGCRTLYQLASPRTMQVFERDGDRCIPAGEGAYRIATEIEIPTVEHVRGRGGRIIVTRSAPRLRAPDEIRPEVAGVEPPRQRLVVGIRLSEIKPALAVFDHAATTRTIGSAKGQYSL